MMVEQTQLPVPPIELAARVGGAYGDYESIGAQQRVFIESMLPDGWSYEGKSVLDFGCGTGRTLTAFASETAHATFAGCDIHAESIDWANRELSPPFRFFVCTEKPPLDQPDASYDLIYAMSVFTHITTEWSRWLIELHRVLRPDGIAVISALGPAMAQQILGRDWDDRIGMAILDLHKDWSIGGPDVLLSEWWIREHWGRAFDIVRFQPCDPAAGAGHDLVTLRRREVEIDAGGLERTDFGDVRELAALQCNLELLMRQQEQLGHELRLHQLRPPPNSVAYRLHELQSTLRTRVRHRLGRQK
jgi:SAM-dependent methyltransferase